MLLAPASLSGASGSTLQTWAFCCHEFNPGLRQGCQAFRMQIRPATIDLTKRLDEEQRLCIDQLVCVWREKILTAWREGKTPALSGDTSASPRMATVMGKCLRRKGSPSTQKPWSKGKENFKIQGISKLSSILRLIFSQCTTCLLYTSPSPRDRQKSRMPSSA